MAHSQLGMLAVRLSGRVFRGVLIPAPGLFPPRPLDVIVPLWASRIASFQTVNITHHLYRFDMPSACPSTEADRGCGSSRKTHVEGNKVRGVKKSSGWDVGVVGALES